MSGQQTVSFVVNGEPKTVAAFPMERLLDVLRRELALTGTKEGCGEGECGACAVLIDGELAVSCLVPVGQTNDANIVTIEGLAADPQYAALRHSFLERGAAQCGICTPGMMLAAARLLAQNPHPTADEIREGLSGNLCRCTGYLQIYEAVDCAAKGDGGA